MNNGNDFDRRANIEDVEQQAPRATMPPNDVVAYTEMRSCHDIWNMKERGLLVIDPEFQRHNVWQPKDQSLFIDSLLKNLPIPSLCLFHDAPRNKRIVVDGLQRISAILKFLDPSSEWTLSDVLGIDERLNGKSVQALRNSNDETIYMIEERVLPVTVIHGDFHKKSHQDYLIQIFSRLNSGGRRLLNQELRNCVYGGRLNSKLKELARTDQWLRFSGMTLKKVDSDRFGQEERILRLFSFFLEFSSYKKNGLNAFLNDTMSKYQNLQNCNFEEFQRTLMEAIVSFGLIKHPSLVPRKNWNVCEAVVLGMMFNVKGHSLVSGDKLNACATTFYNELNKDSLREGVMQPKKVSERIELAMGVFKTV